MTQTLIRATALAAAVVLSLPAHAALGGAPTWNAGASNPDTRQQTVRMAAASAAASTASTGYTVTTTTLPSETVVNEYVDNTGKVFAVSWHGPRTVPLRKLLGASFEKWHEGLDEARTRRGGGNGPIAVHAQDLVVETGGHMGAISGRAWLPSALPAGFNTDQIQ